ncbi:uncharacterized protein BO88DRAFT_402034 [Aspergillus vadensis CBS 113365]|uniref:Uncharacterized protein n=1 Tax=Aspergillus vadensis (strain CBS 113365 / IMI 142717 / IBT 24658) TaxID=1448311 RepID=A0A319BKV1_ASPVC|nr:hypothetical protein BO88DRAFT_402034 [Aspergillus vadensis CBS 113365]PYH72971.1 hypothetical protein BO88DRAFT_402034 [Aspergillus vadensis CBS 113365]
MMVMVVVVVILLLLVAAIQDEQSGIDHFHHRMQHDQHNKKRTHDVQHLLDTSIRFCM